MKSDQDSPIRIGLTWVAVEAAAAALVLSLLASTANDFRLARSPGISALAALTSVVIVSLGVSGLVWWCLQRRTVMRVSKLAEEAARRQATDAERHAGMAEIAAGVLHDVANVLGSIHVSAALAQARIRQSKVAELVRTVELIDEHKDNLADFLSRDPKGRQLPGLLRLLATHLSDERADILRELDVLGKTVGHVKTIVSTQQSYSGTSGVLETADIAAGPANG